MSYQYNKIRVLAGEKGKGKKGFYLHFALYVLASVAFGFVWSLTEVGSATWVLWLWGGWGIGVLVHFLGVSVFSRPRGWEDREIDRETERMRKIKS